MKIHRQEIDSQSINVFIGGYNSEVSEWIIYKGMKLPFVKKNSIVIGIDILDLHLDLIELLHQYLHEFDSINIIGNSFGGLIALSYYFKYPNKVKTLFLIDPSDKNHIKRFEKINDTYLLKFINDNYFEDKIISIPSEIHINFPEKKINGFKSEDIKRTILNNYDLTIKYFKHLSKFVEVHYNSKHNIHYAKRNYINERINNLIL